MAEQKLEQGVLYVKRYPASFDILYFVFKQYSIEDEPCKFMLKNDIQQGSSENLKQVPQNFTEVLTLMTSQIMTSYRETNIAQKKK